MQRHSLSGCALTKKETPFKSIYLSFYFTGIHGHPSPRWADPSKSTLTGPSPIVSRRMLPVQPTLAVGLTLPSTQRYWKIPPNIGISQYEFPRAVLEVLREPLESGEIHIARAARRATFPARFQLVAAMNPCPCGHLGDPQQMCRCTPAQVSQYRGRLSGPLLDRIDIQMEVPALPVSALQEAAQGESSAYWRERIAQAVDRQWQRQQGRNAQLQGELLAQFCALDAVGTRLLSRASETLHLSARAYHRVLRVARSIADLEGSDPISSQHLAEAIQYRRLAQTLAR